MKCLVYILIYVAYLVYIFNYSQNSAVKNRILDARRFFCENFIKESGIHEISEIIFIFIH